MSITKASRKVNISYRSGHRYYKLYRNDPEKKVPPPRNRTIHRIRTQEQIENPIGYINNDKMTLKEASVKADMSYRSAKSYYEKYLDSPDHSIPVPYWDKHYTQDQKNKLISYIVNDKMNIKAAAIKANMSVNAGRRYYHKYFKEQHPDISTPSHITIHGCFTKDQIQEAISYIVNHKNNIEKSGYNSKNS